MRTDLKNLFFALGSVARGGATGSGANELALQVHGVTFKKRAPRAIKEIRAFAQQAMVRTLLLLLKLELEWSWVEHVKRVYLDT